MHIAFNPLLMSALANGFSPKLMEELSELLSRVGIANFP